MKPASSSIYIATFLILFWQIPIASLAASTTAKCGQKIKQDETVTLDANMVCDCSASNGFGNNFAFKLVGPRATLISNGFTVHCTTGEGDVILVVGTDNVVKGRPNSMGIVSGGENGIKVAGGGNHKIKNISTAASSGNGIKILSDNNNIQLNSVESFNGNAGIDCTGSGNVITDNLITNGLGNGIEVRGIGNTISTNTIENIKTGGNGISVKHVNEFKCNKLKGGGHVITGNTINIVKGVGILISTNLNHVEDNTVTRAKQAGIQIEVQLPFCHPDIKVGLQNGLVLNRVVDTTNGSGYFIEGFLNILKQNESKNNAEDGFRVTGTLNKLIQNLADGNGGFAYFDATCGSGQFDLNSVGQNNDGGVLVCPN